MNLGNFGMDSITLAGPLESKLQASKAAGFSQIMLWAKDLASYPGGVDHGDMNLIARHLAKLATLAVPLGVKVGFEALSWGRHVNQYSQSWEAVALADHANLGVVLDSFHILANNSELDSLDDIPSHKIALVQLSDYMWRDIRSAEERLETARHLRVFPGEGTHSVELSEMLMRLDRGGYRGDFSFEVFNDDYLQVPPEIVGRRAYQSAKWVTDQVLRRSLNVRETAHRQPLPA